MKSFPSKSETREYEEVDVVKFLLTDSAGKDLSNMLERKLAIISDDFGLTPADDIGIIRVIND